MAIGVSYFMVCCIDSITLHIDKIELYVEQVMDKCICHRQIPLALTRKGEPSSHNICYHLCLSVDMWLKNGFSPKLIDTTSDGIDDSFIY